MLAIYQRELKSYFTGFIGYVFVAFILLFGGIYTMVINLSNGITNFEYVLGNMSFVFIIAVPVLTMRVFAEERKQKTDLLLYSLPRSMTSIVLGKYLAMLTVLAVPMLVMAVYPIILSMYGEVNMAVAYSAMLGFFLMGSVLIGIGMLVSSFCDNQAIAAAVCFVIVLVNFFISDLASFISAEANASLLALTVLVFVVALIVRYLTASNVAAGVMAVLGVAALVVAYAIEKTLFEGLFAKILSSVSVFDRFYSFTDGVFDLGAVVYFLSVMALMVFYTVQSMERRRWGE
ncbi:MAG: ABC transporter permease [Clostridia bacterium]|nr:ABC transporter permease [Clostridia bacterium]